MEIYVFFFNIVVMSPQIWHIPLFNAVDFIASKSANLHQENMKN